MKNNWPEFGPSRKDKAANDPQYFPKNTPQANLHRLLSLYLKQRQQEGIAAKDL